MTLVTFIIPVRHQDNARDWGALKAKLAHTAKSVANQTSGDWSGVVVANRGADLPDLPKKFSVCWVDFPPNKLHDFGAASRDEVLDAFRADKGRRVLKGMLHSRESRYFMIVDDDDFVSANIVKFVSENEGANGWTIKKGFMWDEGGRFLYEYDDFNHKCGTSLIVRADLYGLPANFEDASKEWIKDMLGSHQRIHSILAERGLSLETLPFRGAVYRVASAGSHSNSPSILKQYVLKRKMLVKPKKLLRNLARLRFIGPKEKREFFGFG